jgi:hypothetical protein
VLLSVETVELSAAAALVSSSTVEVKTLSVDVIPSVSVD